MNTFLGVLAFLAFVGFVIGMIKPPLVIFWSKKKTRGFACLYLVVVLVVFITLCMSSTQFPIQVNITVSTPTEKLDNNKKSEPTATPSETTIDWTTEETPVESSTLEFLAAAQRKTTDQKWGKDAYGGTEYARKRYLKSGSSKANFDQLNGHEKEYDGKKVYIEGEISSIDYDEAVNNFPSFLISQKEGDKDGLYCIDNIINATGLRSGDKVKVYGKVDGIDRNRMPKIIATVIEKY